MDIKVNIDHKVVLAIGASVVGVIFAIKLDPTAVKEVSIGAIGAAEAFASGFGRICENA